jgi:hypothetical protein
VEAGPRADAGSFAVNAGKRAASNGSLSGEDWKLARAKPNRFAVAPHHVADGFEAVITTFPNFWLIEKFGEAGEVAEELASSD